MKIHKAKLGLKQAAEAFRLVGQCGIKLGTEMIETTLKDAVERCEKNGGRIRRIDSISWFNDYNLKMFGFGIDDLKKTWIYEPPKRSAFQEFNRNKPENQNPKIVEKFRKEGWNAAIDAVLNMCLPEDFAPVPRFREKVEQLKEKNNS